MKWFAGRLGKQGKKSVGTFRKQAMLLLVIVLADGALLGAAGGAAKCLQPGHQSRFVSVTTQKTPSCQPKQPKQPEQQIQPNQPNQQLPPNAADSAASIQPDQPASPVEVRQVALTFDDGPHAVCTPKLLDGLKERGVPATFFLMGENIKGNEALVKRMWDEGHLIGNHSYRHIQLTHAGEDAVCQAIEQTEQMIQEIVGVRPQYLRPPYGDWNENLECRMDLTTVFWSVDSLDWKLKNTKRIVARVLKRVGDGDIILMHDIFPTSVEAALALVDRLQAEGYQFVTVDALMID